MGHSGYFVARHLGPEWADYRTLSHVCELARMTNRQAEITLLYTRGMTTREIQRSLGIPNREYWRSHRAACRNLRARFPRLEQIAERVEQQCDDTTKLALKAGKNGSQGARTPLLGEDDSYGETRIYAVGGHPALVTPRDLGHVYVSLLDVLPYLLEELAKAQVNGAVGKSGQTNGSRVPESDKIHQEGLDPREARERLSGCADTC